MAWKWRELVPFYFCATGTVPFFYLCSTATCTNSFSLRQCNMALKWRKCPALITVYNRQKGSFAHHWLKCKEFSQRGPGLSSDLSSEMGGWWGSEWVRGGGVCVCGGQPGPHGVGEKITVIFLHTQIAGKFFVMNQSLSFSLHSLSLSLSFWSLSSYLQVLFFFHLHS